MSTWISTQSVVRPNTGVTPTTAGFLLSRGGS